MANDLPACLRTMSPRSRAQLAEDVDRWGAECASMSYRQILSHTGIGPGRAERLHAWLQRNPPPVGQRSAPNEKPDVKVTQDSPDEITVEVEAKGAHPSADLGQGIVRNLDELIAEAGIDTKVWATDGFQCRTWSTPMKLRRKGGDDELAVIRNWYASAKFHRRIDACVSAADWGERIPRQPKPAGRVMTAVCIPDIHIGYRWSRGHQALHALHDWSAVDAVLQLLEVARPDVVQILGDVLDHAAMSTKFQVPLALRDTVRPSLLTTHAILRAIRSAVRSAAIDWTGGNHDNRTERAHIGTEWDGLTTAADPDGPPVLSFAHLLGLDALDITHRDYGSHRFLFDSILVHHGDKVKSRGGLTVADTIRDSQTSVVFGHIHRVEQASKTLHTPSGPKVVTAVSPGTLARIDGSVPGVTERPDWQQGVAVCTYDTETGQDHWELVHIHGGRLHWRGHAIVGDGARLAREVAAQIKYPQIAAEAA